MKIHAHTCMQLISLLYIPSPSCIVLFAYTVTALLCIHFVLFYVCDVHLVCLSHATGIWFTLNNVQYTNNSVVNITDIGTGSAALNCTTTYIHCCFSEPPPPGTNWYFPNGSQVQNTDTLPYYKTTIDGSESLPGAVLLHRNRWATTTGIFHCKILAAYGNFQSLYVGIYTATTGESCTLKSNTFV